MQADIYSIQGLAGLNEKINQIKRVLNPSLYVKGILLTKYSDRTILNRDLKQNIIDATNTLNTKVFTNSIRERESQTNKTCILITNPNNNASIDYNNFINELLEVQNG